MNVVPCPHCHGQPVIERFRASFWRVRCKNHSASLTGIVAGHPMKTQRSAVEVWNLDMAPAAAGLAAREAT